jgi:hypothetical protein
LTPLTIYRDHNVAISIKKKSIETLKESRYAGKVDPESTSVEIGTIHER